MTPTRPLKLTAFFALGAVLALSLGCSEGQLAIGTDTRGGDGVVGLDGGGGGDGTGPTDFGTNPTPDGTTTSPTDTGGGACVNGQVQCSVFTGNLQSCTNGMWADSEICSNGCMNNACLSMPSAGTCNSPTPIAVGQTLVGTTDTIYNPNQWSSECTSAYGVQTGTFSGTIGPEAVFQLTVTEPQQLAIRVTPVDATYFGVYLRSECTNPATELHHLCDGSKVPGGEVVIEDFFGTGTYFLFVDDFEDPGVFQISVEGALMQACGNQIPSPLDISSPISTTGDTDLGTSTEEWLGSECPTILGTNGKENIYVFGLNRTATVNIAVTPLDPADSDIGIYLRGECADRYDQPGCGYTAGNGTAVITETLPPGPYYLFVDDFSVTTDQVYRLEIQVN